MTAQLISTFVSLYGYYLNPKFQASSHLLWLYSQVCVGPGQKPQRPVFSQRGSYFSRSICLRLLSLAVLMFTLYRLLISEADPDAGQCGNRRWSESEFTARGSIKVRCLAKHCIYMPIHYDNMPMQYIQRF